ncbi:hypothetical protein BCR36DRAFT_375922 [Piromyces finnis]|uniref:Uncharacterized protein n=1 Tax=Piromyces finnis TaxID=1754191 RepID=A0A1Y1U7T2_9FUNG|nr:hypothetical protein BCR36DRAFT_375922 [Piromyces finnis]|eukprot:ORX34091.1 hypothetical protein BCR36DRAFT_375922 [Piromyces finnis]
MNGGDVGISEINLTGGTSNPLKVERKEIYLYIESEDYYEIKSDSSKKAEKVTDKCDGNNRIGLQSSTYGVCLSVEDEEFCKYEDKKIIKRKEQFVDGTILNTLYECADGVCDISKVPENVG